MPGALHRRGRHRRPRPAARDRAEAGLRPGAARRLRLFRPARRLPPRPRSCALGGWRADGPAADYDLALRFAARRAAGRDPAPALSRLPRPAALPTGRGQPSRARARRIAFAPGSRPTGCARRWSRSRAWPKVSVVIPSRDAPALIGETLAGLFERTDYPDFDVTVVDNGSTDPATLALYAAAARGRASAPR